MPERAAETPNDTRALRVSKSKRCHGLNAVTLKCAGTPGRAGTVFTMAGTCPAARAPLDSAWQPMWTLCCGATNVGGLAAQKLRSTAAQQAAATSTGKVRLWEAMASKVATSSKR